MNLTCYCGQGLNLGQKEIQKILIDEELFCSSNCLLKYIKEHRPKYNNLDYAPSNGYVSIPTEFYYIVTNRYYRSAYEAAVARLFTSHSIDFEFEPHAFVLGTKSYTPDFYLPDYSLYIECKGPWAIGSKKKYLAVREHLNIILLPAYFQQRLEKVKQDVVK
jgi:predicted nuclease of restriction endonuclease-like RecB superfamily